LWLRRPCGVDNRWNKKEKYVITLSFYVNRSVFYVMASTFYVIIFIFYVIVFFGDENYLAKMLFLQEKAWHTARLHLIPHHILLKFLLSLKRVRNKRIKPLIRTEIRYESRRQAALNREPPLYRSRYLR
jgi:hypothetical protein